MLRVLIFPEIISKILKKGDYKQAFETQKLRLFVPWFFNCTVIKKLTYFIANFPKLIHYTEISVYTILPSK